jgi:hypothetical protein
MEYPEEPLHNHKLGGVRSCEMTDTPNLNFRDLSGLTAVLKASLGVYMAIGAIGLWSGWLEIEILQRALSGASVSEAEAAASDSRQALLGGLYLLVYVVTGVMFLRWIYLTNRNARSLGTTGMQFTPGWAVGWYFVPVAALWKPYQALKETFKASHPDFNQDWQHAPHPSILPLWWTLWITWAFVAAAFRSAPRVDTVVFVKQAALLPGASLFVKILALSWITFFSNTLDLLLGLVAMVVVNKLQTWQSEKHRRLAANAT